MTSCVLEQVEWVRVVGRDGKIRVKQHGEVLLHAMSQVVKKGQGGDQEVCVVRQDNNVRVEKQNGWVRVKKCNGDELEKWQVGGEQVCVVGPDREVHVFKQNEKVRVKRQNGRVYFRSELVDRQVGEMCVVGQDGTIHYVVEQDKEVFVERQNGSVRVYDVLVDRQDGMMCAEGQDGDVRLVEHDKESLEGQNAEVQVERRLDGQVRVKRQNGDVIMEWQVGKVRVLHQNGEQMYEVGQDDQVLLQVMGQDGEVQDGHKAGKVGQDGVHIVRPEWEVRVVGLEQEKVLTKCCNCLTLREYWIIWFLVFPVIPLWIMLSFLVNMVVVCFPCCFGNEDNVHVDDVLAAAEKTNTSKEFSIRSFCLACSWGWLIVAFLVFIIASFTLIPLPTFQLAEYLENTVQLVILVLGVLLTYKILTLQESDMKKFLKSFRKKYTKDDVECDDAEYAGAQTSELFQSVIDKKQKPAGDIHKEDD